jgi:hypothetical protein
MIHIVPWYIALLSAWACYVWMTGCTQVRYAVALGIAGLILVETAGIVVKSRQRSYIAAEKKLVSFVRTHTDNSGTIIGTAALLYGFDFDSRLLDDMYLGIRSGRVPQVIIVDRQLYQPVYDGWMKQRPGDMKVILRRLAQYRQAYDDGNYRVFLSQHPITQVPPE